MHVVPPRPVISSARTKAVLRTSLPPMALSTGRIGVVEDFRQVLLLRQGAPVFRELRKASPMGAPRPNPRRKPRYHTTQSARLLRLYPRLIAIIGMEPRSRWMRVRRRVSLVVCWDLMAQLHKSRSDNFHLRIKNEER